MQKKSLNFGHRTNFSGVCGIVGQSKLLGKSLLFLFFSLIKTQPIMSGLMLDDVKISMQKFGMPDYIVFIVMLVICALIGVYFGFFEKKPAKQCDEESDYLVGGRQMKVVPIAMSLIARYIFQLKPI